MSLPNRSVRIDPAHADILTALLGQLRAGRAEVLRTQLGGLGGDAPVGPFRSVRAALDFLLGRMVTAVHPQAIWLYGSRAGGQCRPDSDFDFLVLIADADAPCIDDIRERLADAVAGAGVGVDVGVCTMAEFAACRAQAGSLIRSAHEQGREVYAAPALRRLRRGAP